MSSPDLWGLNKKLPQNKNHTNSGAKFILCIGVEKIMSEKQRFNKDIQNRQIAEKRRERWMSRKILTEILENIRLQKNDANWVLYQIFTKENLTYKSKIKIWNHLMRAGYDLAKEKPQKEDKIFSYRKAWLEYKNNNMLEINHKLYQRLDEAEELLEEIWNHLTNATVTQFTTSENAKKWAEILDKTKKRLNK